MAVEKKTKTYLFEVYLIGGKETFNLLDESELIDNENANYFEKQGNQFYLGWKSSEPKINDFNGIIYDIKIYPRTALLNKEDLKGRLCKCNEFSEEVDGGC